jgi:hypothetical protein
MDGDIDRVRCDPTMLVHRAYRSTPEQYRRALTELWGRSPPLTFMSRLHLPQDLDRIGLSVCIYERVMSRTHE